MRGRRHRVLANLVVLLRQQHTPDNHTTGRSHCELMSAAAIFAELQATNPRALSNIMAFTNWWKDKFGAAGDALMTTDSDLQHVMTLWPSLMEKDGRLTAEGLETLLLRREEEVRRRREAEERARRIAEEQVKREAEEAARQQQVKEAAAKAKQEEEAAAAAAAAAAAKAKQEEQRAKRRREEESRRRRKAEERARRDVQASPPSTPPSDYADTSSVQRAKLHHITKTTSRNLINKAVVRITQMKCAAALDTWRRNVWLVMRMRRRQEKVAAAKAKQQEEEEAAAAKDARVKLTKIYQRYGVTKFDPDTVIQNWVKKHGEGSEAALLAKVEEKYWHRLQRSEHLAAAEEPAERRCRRPNCSCRRTLPRDVDAWTQALLGSDAQAARERAAWRHRAQQQL